MQQKNEVFNDTSVKFAIATDAWEISPDHVLLRKALGSGFFGEVYRCTIQGPITTPYTEKKQLNKLIALPAAVKILKGCIII